MRITRLYHSAELHSGESIRLDNKTSNHLIRVLRSRTGTPVILFNGDGYDYHCITQDDNVKKTLLSIESRSETSTESNLSITLIQGLSRQDRMETSIQKAVELGVSKIIPLLCQRSNTRLTKDKQAKKLEHWRNVAISACEQSGRSVIPQVSDIGTFNDFAKSLNANALKLYLNPEATTSLKTIDSNNLNIEILVGPEGGLNKEEINFLDESGFTGTSFGPRILRTETAGPAVISALQTLWGDI